MAVYKTFLLDLPKLFKHVHIPLLLLLALLFCCRELVPLNSGALNSDSIYEIQDLKGDPENGESDDCDEQESWCLHQCAAHVYKTTLISLSFSGIYHQDSSYLAPYPEICLPPPEFI